MKTEQNKTKKQTEINKETNKNILVSDCRFQPLEVFIPDMRVDAVGGAFRILQGCIVLTVLLITVKSKLHSPIRLFHLIFTLLIISLFSPHQSPTPAPQQLVNKLKRYFWKRWMLVCFVDTTNNLAREHFKLLMSVFHQQLMNSAG